MVSEESLRDIGFEPIVADTAAAAMDMLRLHDGLKLAIVDVGLPDERGGALAVRMRAFSPELKIIIASGYDPAQLASQFAEDDLTTILPKPYTQDDLAAAAAALGL